MNNVVTRAKAAGELRRDFVLENLVIALMANAGVVNATSVHAPDAWKRFVAHLLDASRATGRSELPPSVSARRPSRAMRRATR